MSKTQYISKVQLSVRRKEIKGLPGDDASLHNLKIGASLQGRAPLRGLTFDEEKKYLAEIINVSPSDVQWRVATQDYWNNISVKVPADGENTGHLQGLVLNFIIGFSNKADKDAFDSVSNFEEKAEISKRGEVLENVADYILWRYCLVYGRVANAFKDVGKSPKIVFYLYSKANETKAAHDKVKLELKANTLFASILDDESMIDSVLLLFKQDPKNTDIFETLEDKHVALGALIKTKSKDFIAFVEDVNLKYKAFIQKAVEARIITNPTNTEIYYFGENNEVVMGKSLMEAVLFIKSDEAKNKEIVAVIKSKLANLN